jgi:hypothetical protein
VLGGRLVVAADKLRLLASLAGLVKRELTYPHLDVRVESAAGQLDAKQATTEFTDASLRNASARSAR